MFTGMSNIKNAFLYDNIVKYYKGGIKVAFRLSSPTPERFLEETVINILVHVLPHSISVFVEMEYLGIAP